MKTTGDKGLKIIVEFEGEILKVYNDGFGYPTAGVGHLLTPAEKRSIPIGTKITREQSRAWLAQDLKEAEDAVNSSIKVPITQNQFDAMVSLAFNIGVAGYKRSSVVRNLNNRKFAAAADSILAWNKVKGKEVRGLTRRRKAERELFLTPDSTATSAISNPPNTDSISQDRDNTSNPADQGQPSNIAVPLVPTPQPVIEVEAVKAAPTDDKPADESELTKIGNKANAAYTAFGSLISGAIAWFSGSPVGIVASIMGCVAVLGLAYMVINAIRAGQKDKRDRADKLELEKIAAEERQKREERAHEIQMLTLRAASDPNLNAVKVVHPPTTELPNSETPEGQ
jgi:lysozyme